MTRRIETQRTLRAAAVSRRSLLKGAAAAGAGLALSPLVPKYALASSGELNLYSWSDYVYPDMIKGFEAKTGIKLKLSTYGSNDEVLNKLRAAGGEGFDVVMPSITYTPAWLDQDLLQPLDESKVKVDGVIKPMWEASKGLGGVKGGKRYAVPFNWGTEALCIDTSKVKAAYGEVGYGTIWQPEYKGMATVRAHSALLGVGLYLDSIGQIKSNQMRDTYTDETRMKEIYEQCLKFAAARKASVAQFWSNAQETEAAFKQNGAVIGQTWDGPAMRMRTETKGKITYLAPKEGALTWMDSMAVPVKAKNVEQAYAWMNWYYTPENAALHVKASGYNSCTEGAAALSGKEYAENFAAAYPGNAIANLWWYPAESSWFIAARNGFRDRFLAA